MMDPSGYVLISFNQGCGCGLLNPSPSIDISTTPRDKAAFVGGLPDLDNARQYKKHGPV